MKKIMKSIGILMLIVGSSAAIAVPITGSISFAGGSAFLTDTTIEFRNLDMNDAIVQSVDGSFADQGVITQNDYITNFFVPGAPPNLDAIRSTVADFTSFDFMENPFVAIDPLWTIKGFQFKLESLDVGPIVPSVPASGTTSLFSLVGTGTLSHLDYDDTAYTWSFDGEVFPNSGVNFIVSASPVAVPEPGTLALLGLGLMGFVATNRKRRDV